MLAGAGATLEVYNIPFWLGMVGTAAFVVLLFLRDTDGMTTVNAFLIPILILSLVSILLVFQYSLGFSFSFDITHQSNWPSAITFTALNILPIVAVVSAIGNQISHRGEIWIATIGSGLLMGSISYLYNESLLQIANEIMFYEIPLFVILKQYPSVMVVAMSVLLWLAIYTTAGAGIFGLISRLRGVLKGETWLVAMLLLAIILAYYLWILFNDCGIVSVIWSGQFIFTRCDRFISILSSSNVKKDPLKHTRRFPFSLWYRV